MTNHDIESNRLSSNTKLERPYPRVAGLQRRKLYHMLIELHLHSCAAFNLATLEITRLHDQGELHRTNRGVLRALWAPYFRFFDIQLAAQIFALLHTGTNLTRESLLHLIKAPISNADRRIQEFCDHFPDNYRHRTCDLPNWFEHENDASVIPEMKNVTIYSVVEPRVFRVAYDIRFSGESRHSRVQRYVSCRNNELLWLDLGDDQGIAGGVNEVLIQ